MLKSLRQFLSRGQRLGELAVFEDWAQARGYAMRMVRDTPGCVLDGHVAGRACRVEWGPSQRGYIEGCELRLMAETGVHRDLALLMLNRKLVAAMEKTVYEQFVDDVQTRGDADTPAEMRWLVVFARASASELGRLRERYAAATNLMPWLVQWLTTPLNDALAATIDLVPADQPVVITLKSGRLMLRTAMAKPDPIALAQWASVFEHALNEAARMGSAWRDSTAAGPQTQPYAWSASAPEVSAQSGVSVKAAGQARERVKDAGTVFTTRVDPRRSTPSR